jgi:polyhydroxyalkanoate synthase
LTLDTFRWAPFVAADIWRRAHGNILAAAGLGPTECPYRLIEAGSHWRLRDYGNQGNSSAILIVGAPIKRPYIWDLAPSVSAIRHCLANHQHVYLLEWLPASPRTAAYGLEQYAEAIGECVSKVSNNASGPILIGHSLGGTLAAIFSALASNSIGGLVLLGAPLCFHPATSRFRDALVSLVPSDLDQAEPFPGSLLSHISALASPDTFVWSRLTDAAMSVTNHHALEIHARVERWALDEVSLPGRLVHQLIEWLYRENRFCRGELKIGGKLIGPQSVLVPTLAVVNTQDDIAPLGSVKPFIESIGTKDACIIKYPGEVGVCLQHLGVLVGQDAHAKIWPGIISWMDTRRHAPAMQRGARISEL